MDNMHAHIKHQTEQNIKEYSVVVQLRLEKHIWPLPQNKKTWGKKEKKKKDIVNKYSS